MPDYTITTENTTAVPVITFTDKLNAAFDIKKAADNARGILTAEELNETLDGLKLPF